MATLSTGFVTVSDNGTTNLNLSSYTNLESARIRWRDRSLKIEQDSSLVQGSKSGYSPLLVTINPSPVPYGWSFKKISLTSFLTNKDASPQNLEVWAGYDPSHKNINTGSAISYNGTISEVYIETNTFRSSMLGVGDVNPESGASVSLLVGAVTTYWKYLNAGSPQTVINGQTTQYSGTIPTGQMTEWQSLKGLRAGQNNSIRHDLLYANSVDVEIEYTVSLSPSVETQEATDISYTVGTINGIVNNEGFETAHAYFEYGETQEFGTVIDIGEVIEGVPFEHEITGLGYSKTIYYRSYATNSDGTGYGDTLSFTTLYPSLEAPTREDPTSGEKITDRRPYFIFTLTENTNNDATKYHARIRFSEYVNMQNATIFESSSSQVGWEYWNGSTWVAFQSNGVDPNTKVRFRTSSNLSYITYYWDCASSDITQYGYNSMPWNFRIMLSADSLYLLVINSVEYNIYSLIVKETANGQIGQIEFEVNNNNGATNTAIAYGDDVNVAINDVFGNSEEYKGKVRTKSIQNYALKITAITGSGILAERRIKEDYANQDIGLTIKDIIDDYCDPLTSTNINTSTGISAPITAKDKTPLTVLEELRRQYGIMYFVDKDWDMHTYLPSDISNAFTTIKHGEGI